jgi:hypothetical protein
MPTSVRSGVRERSILRAPARSVNRCKRKAPFTPGALELSTSMRTWEGWRSRPDHPTSQALSAAFGGVAVAPISNASVQAETRAGGAVVEPIRPPPHPAIPAFKADPSRTARFPFGHRNRSCALCQADLVPRVRSPCPIRAPEEAAIPVSKPDRSPRPASPFWARKARVIRGVIPSSL